MARLVRDLPGRAQLGRPFGLPIIVKRLRALLKHYDEDCQPTPLGVGWPHFYAAPDRRGSVKAIFRVHARRFAPLLLRNELDYDVAMAPHRDPYLTALAAAGTYEFMFILTHYKTRGSTASDFALATVI